MKSLIWFKIENNNLTSVPKELGSLEKLEWLKLEGNEKLGALSNHYDDIEAVSEFRKQLFK